MIEKKNRILNNALKRKNLKTLDKKTFLSAWKALAFLFSGLVFLSLPATGPKC